MAKPRRNCKQQFFGLIIIVMLSRMPQKKSTAWTFGEIYFLPFTKHGSMTAGFQIFDVSRYCRNTPFSQRCLTSLCRFVKIAPIGPRMVENVQRYHMICIVRTFYVQMEWKSYRNAARSYKWCEKWPFQGDDLLDNEKKCTVKSIIMNIKY